MRRRDALRSGLLAGAALAMPATGRAGPPRRSPAGAGIIDSHVHLKHGDAARTEFPARTIVEVMDAAGIDRSVVFAICTSGRRAIAMAEAAVAEFPERLIAYAYGLPSYERPVLKDLEAALAGGVFRGIKVHAGECTLADYVIDPLLKLAGRLGVPCLIDAAGNLAAARRIAGSFPETTVVFAHMGRYGATDAALVDGFIGLAGDHERVYLDLSGVALEARLAEAARRLGPGKLIWGTDGPYAHPDLVAFARDELAKIRRLPIDEAGKAAILGGNVAGLLGLPDRPPG